MLRMPLYIFSTAVFWTSCTPGTSRLGQTSIQISGSGTATVRKIDTPFWPYLLQSFAFSTNCLRLIWFSGFSIPSLTFLSLEHHLSLICNLFEHPLRIKFTGYIPLYSSPCDRDIYRHMCQVILNWKYGDEVCKIHSSVTVREWD